MRLGRLAGAAITVHPLFLVLLFVYGAAGLLPEVLLLVALLISHELAHLTAARAYDLAVGEIEFLPFGGRMRIYGLDRQDAAVEVMVALAGPLNHLLLLAVAVALQRHWMPAPEALDLFVTLNLSLALFNLLPALPLDGGRVARAFLAREAGYLPATRRVARWGRLLGIGLVIGALAAAAGGALAPTLFLVAGFLYWAAAGESEGAGFGTARQLMAKRRRFEQGEALPVRGILVRGETPLRDIFQRLTPQAYHQIWVADAGFRINGVVGERRLVEILRRRGLEATASDLLEEDRRH